MAGLQLKMLFPRLATPKVAFRNGGDLTFEEVAAKWGLNTAAVSPWDGELADLDNDGDLDLIVNNMDEPAEIYRNDPRPRASRLV